MSSFKDKAARAEKQKTGREPKKGAPTDASTLEQTEGTTEQDQELAPDTTIEREEASLNTTGEFYGEDQQEDDQEKPKWERTIPLDRIRPNPYQPRKTFDPDKLNELASGMKEHGWVGGGLPVVLMQVSRIFTNWSGESGAGVLLALQDSRLSLVLCPLIQMTT